MPYNKQEKACSYKEINKEQIYEELIEKHSIGTYIANAKGVILSVNKRFLDIFELKKLEKGVVEFDNNASGWQQLFKKFSGILPNSLVTLENTGKYELGLSHFLIDKNIAVHRANTRKVKSP